MSQYVNLRHYLAERYYKQDDARLLANNANVDTTRVEFEGSAILFWDNLVREACFQKKIENLMEQVLHDEVPLEIKALIEKFLQEVRDGSFSGPNDIDLEVIEVASDHADMLTGGLNRCRYPSCRCCQQAVLLQYPNPRLKERRQTRLFKTFPHSAPQ